MPALPDGDVFCIALDTFSVPAALADLTTDAFFAWNKRFLDVTGLGEDEAARVRIGEIVTIEWPPATKAAKCETAPHPVHFVACTVRSVGTRTFAAGQAFKRDDDFVLILLDSQINAVRAEEFLEGLRQGKQEENRRLQAALKNILTDPASTTAEAAKELQGKLDRSDKLEQGDLKTIARAIEHLPKTVRQALSE
jgi:hypothetical protein